MQYEARFWEAEDLWIMPLERRADEKSPLMVLAEPRPFDPSSAVMAPLNSGVISLARFRRNGKPRPLLGEMAYDLMEEKTKD